MDTNIASAPLQTPHYSGQLRVRACGICLQNKKILLVHHHQIAGQYNLWSPPGGGVAFGETVQACLVREFKEETGLTVKPGRFLFMSEFLQPPLHALELFFEVHLVAGQLRKGSDPELEENKQLIREVAFKTLAELRRDCAGELHPILQDLIDLDDLYMPQHRFIK
ncbi:MAG: NUDIX domain-containing protein [Adhaeribacter sp.]